MIKHRFIVSREDFRIFAAIPTEVRLLTWKRWSRPADWTTLAVLYDEAIAVFEKLEVYWEEISSGYLVTSKVVAPVLEDVAPSEVEEDIRRMRGAQSAEYAIIAGTCRQVLQDLRGIASKLVFEREGEVRGEALPGGEEKEIFSKAVDALLVALAPSAKGDVTVDLEALETSSKAYADYYKRFSVQQGEGVRLQSNTRGINRTSQILSGQEVATIRDYSHTMWEAHDALCALMQLVVAKRLDIIHLLERARELDSCEPTAAVECPAGIPFAAYTVELDDVVVNVVEGHAWVEGRKETEDERRVTEILSQMLTERGLNPKADTRVPIREVDPKHAAQQRDADRRPGPPRVRTIKLLATPPRYLREAAEHILASPRRAHWVVGHWRNQAFGEKMTQHRQTWIKPHIRGLGEASAATTRVTAPKEGQ